MNLTNQGLLGPLPSVTVCVEAYLSSPTEQGKRNTIAMLEMNLTLDCGVGVDKVLQGLLRGTSHDAMLIWHNGFHFGHKRTEDHQHHRGCESYIE